MSFFFVRNEVTSEAIDGFCVSVKDKDGPSTAIILFDSDETSKPEGEIGFAWVGKL